MSSKTAHYYVVNYQYDFVDMQAEVKKLTGIIRMLKNLPSPNRTKDVLLIKWRVYHGVTPTEEWQEQLRTIKSILNTFRRRRSFVLSEMMQRMVEMHVKWHFYGDQLKSEGVSPPPTRRLNPFPYKFNEIRLKISVIKLPKLLQPKVNYFRSRGRFQDAVQELPIFGEMNDTTESNKTGHSEDLTNEIFEEEQPMDLSLPKKNVVSESATTGQRNDQPAVSESLSSGERDLEMVLYDSDWESSDDEQIRDSQDAFSAMSHTMVAKNRDISEAGPSKTN